MSNVVDDLFVLPFGLNYQTEKYVSEILDDEKNSV